MIEDQILPEIYKDRPTIPDSAIEAPPPVFMESSMDQQSKFKLMNFTDMVDMEVISMVTGRKKSSETWRQDKQSTWDKLWDHYLQVYDTTGKEAWQSRLFMPDTNKVTEIITSNMVSAMLTPDLPVEWQSRVKKHDETVRGINDIIKSDIFKNNFKTEQADILRSTVLLGTGVSKISYEKENDLVMVKHRQKTSYAQKVMAQVFGMQVDDETESFVPQRILVKDNSRVEYRDLYKIFPEPYTTEISKDTWIIEESQITNRELVKLANHEDPFYRLRNVSESLLASGGSTEEQNEETQSRRQAMMMDSTSLTFYDPDRQHKLTEYWGPVPIWMVFPEKRNDESSRYESVNAWIWVIDDSHVVRATLNPFRDGCPPYVKYNYIRVPDDWYGLGAGQIMMNLQIYKNELINTKTDNVNLILNVVMALLKDKVPQDCWNRLKSAPGAMWLFENTDDIRKVVMPVQFPNLIKDIYMSINEVDRAIQEVTGAVSATAGVGGGSDEATNGTFRGQMLNVQSASQRWMNYARVMEANGLRETFRKIYHRIYQFKSYESVKAIIGDERSNQFEFIAPELLEQVATLVPIGVMTAETKGVKQAQMTQFAETWQQRPWLKEFEIARKQWLEMGYSDPDSVIFSQEEFEEFNNMRRTLLDGGGAGNSMTNEPPEGMQNAQPIAGNTPPPNFGQPMPAMPPRGPGASPADMNGRPVG